MLKAPSLYDPRKYVAKADARRTQVFDLIASAGLESPSDVAIARTESILVR